MSRPHMRRCVQYQVDTGNTGITVRCLICNKLVFKRSAEWFEDMDTEHDWIITMAQHPCWQPKQVHHTHN